MLRTTDIAVFCAHCGHLASLRAWSSEDNQFHNIFWPDGWAGIYDGHGFFSKCSYCKEKQPAKQHEYVYYGVLVVGLLTEQAIWQSAVKVGSKINFDYDIMENDRFIGNGKINRRMSTGHLGINLSKWL
jgi:hypothetical protein